jgi:hypothetical protein
MIDELLSREHVYKDEIESIRLQARKSYVEKIAEVLQS